MSHFTECKCQISNRADLEMYLKAMGYQILNTSEITGYNGKLMTVDFAVKTDGYSIGFKKNSKGFYDVIADWWGVKNSKLIGKSIEKQKIFMAELNQCHVKSAVTRFAKKGRYTVKEQLSPDNVQYTLVRRMYGGA